MTPPRTRASRSSSLHTRRTLAVVTVLLLAGSGTAFSGTRVPAAAASGAHAPLASLAALETTTTLTTTQENDAYGVERTLTATVTTLDPKGVEPTGTVYLMRGAEVVRSERLTAGGVATFTVITSKSDASNAAFTARFVPLPDRDDLSPSASAPLTLESYVALPTISLRWDRAQYGAGDRVSATISVTSDKLVPNGFVMLTMSDGHPETAYIIRGGDARIAVPSEAVAQPGSLIPRVIFASSNALGQMVQYFPAITIAPAAVSLKGEVTSVSPRPGDTLSLRAVVSRGTPGVAALDGAFNVLIDGVRSAATITADNTSNGLRAVTLTGPALSGGDHTVQIEYTGSATDATVTTPVSDLHVAKFPTTTSTVTMPLVSTWGSPLTYPISVGLAEGINTGAGPSTPTGQVQLLVDGTPAGDPVDLDGIYATLDVGMLLPGTHQLAARYLGSADFAVSTGAAWSQTVLRAQSRTSIQPQASPIPLGTTASVTSIVDVDHADRLPAEGKVVFSVSTPGAAEPVEISADVQPDGTATLELPATALGDTTIFATFGGDGAREGSVSAPVTVSVVPAPTVSPSPSATPSISATPTSTAGPTGTATATPSAPTSPTGTATPSISAIPSAPTTPSASASPTMQPTPSATLTPSAPTPSATLAPGEPGPASSTTPDDPGNAGALPGTGSGGAAVGVLLALGLLLSGLVVRARGRSTTA